MRHFFAFLFVLALSALPAFAESAADTGIPTSDGTVRVGDIAPDFKLTTLDGKPMYLTDCVGRKATMIVFWSFFCFPCQAEMPELQSFYEDNKDEVSLMTIALDGPQYDKFILPFVAEKKLTYPISYDRENEQFFETASKYGVVGTPTTFILDDQLRVRFIHLGRLDNGILREIVKSVKAKTYCADIIKPVTPRMPPPPEQTESK